MIEQPEIGELLRARYGAAMLLDDGPWNETLATLIGHRSVRAYQDAPLPPRTLELMVAAAQSASTSSNLQTWSVVAAEEPAQKARLAELGGQQAFIAQAPLFLVWLADLSRLARVADARALPHAGLDYFEMFLMGAIDASLAAQNAAVAAEALGLGVVYVGGMRNQPEAVAETLGLPPLSFAVFGMAVGVPDPARPAAVKPRLPQAAVLHRERYNPEQAAAVDEYVDAMDRFYQEQQMRTKGDWAEHSARRVAGPESLSGRDRLREALRNLGFELK